MVTRAAEGLANGTKKEGLESKNAQFDRTEMEGLFVDRVRRSVR